MTEVQGLIKSPLHKWIANKRKYLYPLWNRMASGSYFPKPVRQKFISKGGGKKRALGIPTVTDRVAQQVIATELENIVDKTVQPKFVWVSPEYVGT